MIVLKNIKKSYKNHDVLININLVINSGEMIAIMGRSGSGKSTLLNIIAGLELASDGEYHYKNTIMSTKSIYQLADFRRLKIGYIDQHYSLISSKDVFKNIELPLHYSRLTMEERQKKVKYIAHLLELEMNLNAKVENLSGGERQKVAIARALVQNPEMILADEPTGSLDMESSIKILDIFRTLKQTNKTIIIVTHDEKMAEICDKIYIVNDGTVSIYKY